MRSSLKIEYTFFTTSPLKSRKLFIIRWVQKFFQIHISFSICVSFSYHCYWLWKVFLITRAKIILRMKTKNKIILCAKILFNSRKIKIFLCFSLKTFDNRNLFNEMFESLIIYRSIFFTLKIRWSVQTIKIYFKVRH
jgi:hypothetical protein